LCSVLVVKKTVPVIRVALHLLTHPTDLHWGYQIAQRTSIKPGVLYPILGRFLAAGWLTDGWETTQEAGGPPRRFYKLTEAGGQDLEQLTSEARGDPRFTHLFGTFINPA
jgi:DNA-binding PadR family transcriptional regulator